MPLALRHSINLPFVRINRGGSVTFHLGPWSYNTRHRQHTVKVSKRVKYRTKSTTQRRRETRAGERITKQREKTRQEWEQKFTTDPELIRWATSDRPAELVERVTEALTQPLRSVQSNQLRRAPRSSSQPSTSQPAVEETTVSQSDNAQCYHKDIQMGACLECGAGWEEINEDWQRMGFDPSWAPSNVGE